MGFALAFVGTRLHTQQLRPDRRVATAAVVVECRIGDVASRVIEAQARGDTLMLPVAPLLALAGLDSTSVTGARPLAAVSTLLHADVSFDAGTLVVQFADSGTLPVSRRAVRARMRTLLRERERDDTQLPPVLARVPRTPSALVAGYSVQRDGALAIDAASRAFGGTLEGSAARPASGRVRATLGWSRVPAPSGRGSRVRIGTLDELAGTPGILLTNAPLLRADTFRVASLVRVVAPGTELALFDDGVLVAADSAGEAGLSRLRVPYRYGTHLMQLVAYDPSGGERKAQWVVSAQDALLPARAFRYTLAAGPCAGTSCPRVAARVAYAPTDGVTVGTGLAPPLGGAGREPLALSVALDARVGESAALSLRRGGFDHGTAEFRVDRGVGRALVLRSDAAAAPIRSSLLPFRPGVARRVTSAVGSWAVPGGGSFDLAGAFTRSAVALGSAATLRAGAGLVQASVAFAGARGARPCAEWSAGALVRGASLATVFAPLRSALLRSALLRMRVERYGAACGASSASTVFLVLPTAPLSALQLSASWDGARGLRHPVLALALRRRIGSSVIADAELTGGDGARGARSGITGSVVLDGLRRSVSLTADASGASAGVHGIVYTDANANGRHDPGEVPVAGALVRSGEVSAVTDARGVFALSRLPPDRLARLSVDSLSVEDAGLVPAGAVGVVVMARTTVRVDLALRRSGPAVPP